MLNVLDLFSGIGGFSLGLERAGMRTVTFCEIDPYCQAVLRKHWPDVPIWADVTKLSGTEVISVADAKRCERRTDDEGQQATERNGHSSSGIDIICGGFPCQDISVAGKGAGIEGERSGLWKEYARIIGEVRPRYVIVENVSALLGRGLGVVLGDLAALGFDAEWHCIPAAAVGAPHRRDRVWIVAHSNSNRCEVSELLQQRRFGIGGICEEMANSTSAGLEGWHQSQAAWSTQPQPSSRSFTSNTNSKPTQRLTISWGECSQWLIEPDVDRVAHGVPSRVDRLRALGNAIVPQIAEIIGRAIIEVDKQSV